MSRIPTVQADFPELSWLADVQEIGPSLRATRPISVRHSLIYSGLPDNPCASRHPYCELALILQGGMLHYSQGQQVQLRPNDLFLAGPAAPHFSTRHTYPMEWITVYFLPSLLMEAVPASEGQQLLQRVVADSSSGPYIRPRRGMNSQLRRSFGEMAVESSRKAFGSEIRLRALLVEALVGIIRDEQQQGRALPATPRHDNWVLAERALLYLHEHFSERIYARDLAAAAGVSQAALPKLFRECLGMPWVQYLQGYRVKHAAALLLEPGQTVTDAALAVGFEDQSHFIDAFKAFTGVSPSAYAKSHSKNAGNPRRR